MYIAAQIIGIVGFIVSVIGILQKRDNHMRNYLGLSSSLVSVSYYLSGIYTGAYVIAVSAVRNFLAARGNQFKKFFPLFIAINITVGIYGFRHWYDILPLIGVMFSTVSVFKLEGMRFRVGMMISCCIWLIYNIITFSIGPMLMESSNVIASIYSIRRIRLAGRIVEVKSE